MISRIQNLNEKTVLRVLIAVAVVSLGFSALSHWINGEIAWWAWADGAFQNFSTEMMGAVVTFFLFNLVIGVRNEKKNLIIQLRSKDNATALGALEQIKENGWHEDGTLRGADLWQANLQAARLLGAELQGAILKYANLQGASLTFANLQGASLRGANLQGVDLNQANLQATYVVEANLQRAKLLGANLKGADLRGANLQGADLRGVKFDEKTVLPDAQEIYHRYDKYWTPETDMSRYTDPNHPDFWQPDWVKEQKEK
jgi:hypothetical protein